MTFWDKLKPAPKVPQAVGAARSPDGRRLELDWDDGRHASLSAQRLRQECPCAQCVDEWSGKRTLELQSIGPEMEIAELSQVGNYALSFVFKDQHRTGIYNWELLRRLSEEPR